MTSARNARRPRRIVTIPAMLAMTLAGLALAPLALPLLGALDVLRGRRRLPLARVYVFALQYGVNDCVEIVLAPLFWLVAGFGTRLDSAASIRRHQRVQMWSLRLLAARADRLLGLGVTIGPDVADVLRAGPVIVVARHVSVFDASLAPLAFDGLGLQVRGVVMEELLADPGFDLFYQRTGSAFIPRDDPAEALAAIEHMTTGADHRSAFVIYPEGRLFRPAVRDRLLARIRASDPARGERLAGLRHCLPPKATGLGALLDAVPDADVVVLDHRGLDRWPGLGALLSAVPIGQPVSIETRRIPRADVPSGVEDRAAWLDELWLGLDAALDRELSSPKRS